MKKMIIALIAVLLLSACGKQEIPAQTATFTLDSNPTTGFSWRVEQSEELFQVDSVYTPDKQDEAIVGSGGIETITLIPLKSGKTEVTLSYVRPWEGGEMGDQIVYSFEIDKNLQVKMIDVYSLGAEEPVATPTPEIR